MRPKKSNTDDTNMMMNTTLNQLRSLRLETMAQAIQQQLPQTGTSGMSFEERLALVVDREKWWQTGLALCRVAKTAGSNTVIASHGATDCIRKTAKKQPCFWGVAVYVGQQNRR